MGEQPNNPENTVNAADQAAEAGAASAADAAVTAPVEATAAAEDTVPSDGGAVAAAITSNAASTPTGSAFAIPEISGSGDGATLASIDLLDDVDLDVKVELGRTEMYIEDVLRLGVGSVVELNKLAGDPVDVYVNSRLVARGEVLVLNDNFCVRISDIVSPLPDLG